MVEKILCYVKNIFYRDHFVENCKDFLNLRNKLILQILISCGFLVLSIANILSQSYKMLVFTAIGCVVNIVFAVLGRWLRNGNLCAFSAIATCSVLFGIFVIYGGNDGFACLWVVLLPFVAMMIMNFTMGLCASVFFQVFLVIVFWTPVRQMLFYRYNDQFCLRFPLFFFIAFALALALTISLRRSEYNEYKHLIELEKMTDAAHILARTDPLTKLANRRFAYEEFENKYTQENSPHCIVMGDVDSFKKINDTYGHKFGDDALITISAYITKLLPQDYLKVRWGGEEFLFAANAPLQEVYEQVENLRKTIACHEFICNGTPVHIMITFGIAEYKNNQELPKAIISADDRLYMGKKTNKNCTVAYDSLIMTD